VTRAAVLLYRAVASPMAQLGAIQGVAPSFGVEVSSIDLQDAGEVEHAITAFARATNGGLILTGVGSGARRELIIALAARHRLPAVYPFPFHVTSGGLTSYGPDITDQYRLAAGYVDRILKGEKPADLPVQAATKYRLAINLKTAKALGLDVPPTLLARADERVKRRAREREERIGFWLPGGAPLIPVCRGKSRPGALTASGRGAQRVPSTPTIADWKWTGPRRCGAWVPVRWPRRGLPEPTPSRNSSWAAS
jgi:ABC transporter substrate binding protein